MRRNTSRRVLAVLLAFLLAVSVIPAVRAEAANPKLNKTSIVLAKGASFTLKVSGASGKVTWKSKNKSVAAVSKAGKVTGKKKGSTSITATLKSGKKLTCKVTVNDGPYTNLSENNLKTKAGNEKLYVSKGRSFTVKIYSAAGKAYDGKKVAWASLDTSVATVSKAGKVTGKKKGTTHVTASVAGTKFDILVTVEEPYQTRDPKAYDNGKQKNGGLFTSLQGVTWEQLPFYKSRFTCRVHGTEQKVVWRVENLSRVIYGKDYYDPDDCLKDCNNGVLSGNKTSNTVVWEWGGVKTVTYRVTATLADGTMYNYYLFYNDSSVWVNIRPLKQMYDECYEGVREEWPQALVAYEDDFVFSKYDRKKDQWVVCSKEECYRGASDNTTLGFDIEDRGMYIKSEKYGKVLERLYNPDGTPYTEKVVSVGFPGTDFTGYSGVGEGSYGNDRRGFKTMLEGEAYSHKVDTKKYIPICFVCYVSTDIIEDGACQNNTQYLFQDDSFVYYVGGMRYTSMIYDAFWISEEKLEARK